MNIFTIGGNVETGEIDWLKSAEHLDDTRISKMFTDNCQVMSAALNELAGKRIAPYSSYKIDCPCSSWVQESSTNFKTMLAYTTILLAEYAGRFKNVNVIVKRRKVLAKLLDLFMEYQTKFKKKEKTDVPIDVPKEFLVVGNPVLSYRKFFASKKVLRYHHKQPPEWLKEMRGDARFLR